MLEGNNAGMTFGGTVRSMDEMLASLPADSLDLDNAVHVDDGWRRSFLGGAAFRHEYDREVASGAWEFYRLLPGLCLAVVDMVAAKDVPRRHALEDHLVLSAVVEGIVPVDDVTQGVKLVNGHCAVYGLSAGEEIRTHYRAGDVLRWVSVFLDRRLMQQTTGIALEDLPEAARAFVEHGTPMPLHNVPLSPGALLAVTQTLECSFEGGFRRAFLTGKALELASHILSMLDLHVGRQMPKTVVLSRRECARLPLAMQRIKDNLAEPPDIAELARVTGLNRHKLQLGFQLFYGDTVARVCDRLRMDHALHLVRNTNTSMIDIALETGYGHPASFTRAFRTAHNMSPIHMRRLAQSSAMHSEIRKRKA